MDVTLTEQDESHSCSTHEECPGCVERDLEIARLVALNQKFRSPSRKFVIALVGWLAIVCVPILLLSLGMRSVQSGSTWVSYLVSNGTLVSLIIVSFAFSPVVLLIDWRPRMQKVLACCLLTTGVMGVWYIARVSLSDFEELTDEVLDFSALLPIGVLFTATPMMIMKLWRRWKLTSLEVGKIGRDPSISTILIITAVVAACLASFQFVAPAAVGVEDISIWLRMWYLIYMLGIPSLTIGIFIVASFYCVLTKTRLVKSALVLMTCVLVGTFVPTSMMLLYALATAEDIDPSGEFWLTLFGPSLTCSLVCLIIGLLLAYYLRLLGYQLITQHDHVHRSSDEPDVS
jgi:hypothetical protein